MTYIPGKEELASGKIYIGNSGGLAVEAAVSGDATLDNTGALTIAAKAVDVAMLADGTDGELITWGADGVATTVPVGTATHVLTSNGAGAAPTFQAGGGGSGTYGSMPYVIPITMEVPQGTNAYPDSRALATGGETGALGMKMSGMVLVNGAGVISKINWKLAHPIPDALPTSPVFTVRTTFMTLGAVAGPKTLHIELFYTARADTEDMDVVLTDDIADATVTMPTSTEYMDILNSTLVTAPAAGDFVYGILKRDSAQAEDDFTDDVMVVNMCLIITGS